MTNEKNNLVALIQRTALDELSNSIDTAGFAPEDVDLTAITAEIGIDNGAPSVLIHGRAGLNHLDGSAYIMALVSSPTLLEDASKLLSEVIRND